MLTFAALKGAAARLGWSCSYLAYYESFVKHISPALYRVTSFGDINQQ
jgi:hypothetical protein